MILPDRSQKVQHTDMMTTISSSSAIPSSKNNSPKSPFILHLLSNNTPIILDGALATYLESLGADVSSALWSAQLLTSNPELIYRAHLDYFRAGANVAITASYQASILGLKKHADLSEDEAVVLVEKSAELAFRARNSYLEELDEDERTSKESALLVAGSVGPYGAFLADGSEYRGDYSLSKEETKNFHRGRVSALIRAGVDVLACETMPSFEEAKALVELLAEEFPDALAWFSFTMRDANTISDGTSLEDVVEVLEKSRQVIAIGINCVSESGALDALRSLSKLTTRLLVVYPNSGEQWDAGSRSWHGKRTEGSDLQELAKAYWKAGARLIGGCCRTTPDDIRTIRGALREVGL